MALETIIGLGLATFLLFFFISQLEEEHGILKLLGLFFVLALLLLFPKTVLDAQTVCEPVINTTSVNANTTTYTYKDFCFTQEKDTNTTFFKAILWFYRLFVIYVLVYLGYKAILTLNKSFQDRGRR